MRLLTLLLMSIATLLTVPASAEIQPGSCGGTDILVAMQDSNPERYARIMTRAEEIPNGQALLWRIEREGVPASYVFGTIHISDPRTLEFSQTLMDAFEASDTAIFELKIPQDPQEMAKWAAGMMRLTALGGSQTLKDYLSDEEEEKLAEAARELGLYGLVPFLMKPEILAMQLSMSKCYLRQMKKGAKGVDFTLTDYAYAGNKTVVGLETVEEQLAAISNISLDDGLEYLRYTLTVLNEGEDNAETLVRRYLDRRIDVLWAWSEIEAEKMGMEDGSYQAVMEDLLDKRNFRMVERSAPYIDAGGAFIAIGALHLPGENGLVALFRQRGYTVTAIY